MKKLNGSQVISGEIEVWEEDLESVMEHFNKDIELFYDEDSGHIVNEGGIYIADILSINRIY